MDRIRSGLQAPNYVSLSCMALIYVLVACVPMAGQGMPPLFPTRTRPAPTATAMAVTTTPAPVTPTSISAPTPLRTAAPLAAATIDPKGKAWLDRAGLTGEAAANQDWDLVQRTARTEGRVVLCSDTARMLTALESFLLLNPSLDGEVRVVTSDDAFRDLLQPVRDPNTSEADIYLGGDVPLVMQALAQNRLWNYVPADQREALPLSMREPLLVHHWSALILIQAGKVPDEAAIDSWWDLTREEWRGRVAIPDPAIDKRSAYFFVTFAQHAEDLARAYRVEFGRELVLGPECPDAACQWMVDLLRNEPRVLASDAEVAAWVSDPAASMGRVGICGSEQLAKVQRGKLSLSAVSDIAPAAGLLWPTYLAMVVEGQNPYAARVMIHWLMSDTVGDGAYAPWYEAGLYPARVDMPDPPGSVPRGDLEPRLWLLDARFALDHEWIVRDWVKGAMEDKVVR